MRFRLSTAFLTFALVCVSLGWGLSEWRDRTSNSNEFGIASELARFNAYNDVYRTIDVTTLTPQRAESRRRLLQNTVKTVPYLLSLPIPNRHQVLSYEYDSALDRIAAEALQLLKIKSPEEFEAAIIADGELTLLDWDARNPDRKILIQVLDPNTKKLNPEFTDHLVRILAIDLQR